MTVTIRKFTEHDIDNKLKWINDEKNNRFLHYDLPLERTKTELWFNKISKRNDRYDCVVLADGIPCGITGLLNIDGVDKTAELYITVGEEAFKRKGIASKA